jgi:RNA polymerase sigma-70 factor, ECF subfamily
VERVDPSGQITRLLGDIRQGRLDAADELIPLVYSHMRTLARGYLQGERGDHTLQPTVLVNDALMRLLGNHSMDWQNRAHFFAVASQVMRRILIDYARSHKAEKRGGDFRKLSLDEELAYDWRQADALLALDQALAKLEGYDSRMSKIVEMRFFGGMTEDEAAEVLRVSVRTVKRDWQFARAWLYGEMTRR